MAPELLVVDMQVLHAAATLAAPGVALQDLPAEFSVACCIKAQGTDFGEAIGHDAFRFTSDRKVSRWDPGRNWK
jgi:hypothetical protein